MFKFLKKKEEFGNIVNGKVINIEQVPDPMFAQRMLGDGFGVEPQDGTFVSPVSGTVNLVFPTGHAFGITDANGVEILIHVGINTVELEGKGFQIFVEQGQKINKGDKLVQVDLKAIEDAGISTTTAVIFTSGQKVKVLKENQVCSALEEGIIEII